MVAVPLRDPAVAVVMPTTRLELLVAPGAKLVNEPLAVRRGFAVLIEVERAEELDGTPLYDASR